jgi:hypothetical protein
MKKLLGLAAALAVSAGAAAAQPAPVKNPDEPLKSLHAEALIPVLGELGLSYQGATLPDGTKVVLAEAPNGLKFQMTPTACDEAGRCKGVNMLALFQTRAQERVVSAFNYRYAFVSTGLDDSGVAYISRYDIADYGMPRGNLAVSIQTYLYMASLFDRHLYEATNTVSLEPDATDLAAHALNMQAVLADAKLSDSLGLEASSHEVSFEKVTAAVDTFIKADSLAPGRIINDVHGRAAE